MTSQPSDSDRTPLTTVGRLARALDDDDFAAVRASLHPDVTYRIGREEHHGPDAVVSSYADGSARARALFDRVDFDHTLIGPVGERTIRVDFSDQLEVAGDVFAHHSVQDIEVADDGLVVSIVDQPVAGQRARLDAFMARHGLARERGTA